MALVSALKNDNCQGWKVFLHQAAALSKHASVTAIMVGFSLPFPQLQAQACTPSLCWQPSQTSVNVCVRFCVSLCVHILLQCCANVRSCALTHLELELSALRNVDINQSHREWCRRKFLLRVIPHTRTQGSVYTQPHMYPYVYCT